MKKSFLRGQPGRRKLKMKPYFQQNLLYDIGARQLKQALIFGENLLRIKPQFLHYPSNIYVIYRFFMAKTHCFQRLNLSTIMSRKCTYTLEPWTGSSEQVEVR